MRSLRLREFTLLFTGDLVFLHIALWATLAVRHLAIPSSELLWLHLVPFWLLFAVWLFVFFIAGLYDQHTIVFRTELPERILRVQIANILLAAAFFFVVPLFGIAPKTVLALYLGLSFVLMVFWRVALVPRLMRRERRKALLIAGGAEFKELLDEVNGNARYPFRFVDTIRIDRADGGTLADDIFSKMKDPELAFLVVDARHKKLSDILPHLYKPIFSNVQFIDARDLYEEIFERVPLAALEDPHFAEELHAMRRGRWYAAAKRLMDIGGALAMGLVVLLTAPFVWLATRFEGPGPLLIAQDRLGRHGARVKSYKFRSMRENHSASAAWVHEGENRITRTGAILRKTSLDEFPQFLNVLAGDISLIGPRNDIEGLAKRLSEAIPLYDLRYTVKPGLTGWAQINQRYAPGNISPQSIEETKLRLLYDFYYIKHRSLLLDIYIALKTLRRMVFRASS